MDQLRAMRVFVRVIDEGSFAGAARALDMAPAVVTRTVAELEEHLGTRLINRTTRSLALTAVGSSYLERVRQILEDVEAADLLAVSASGEVRGRLRIAGPYRFLTGNELPHVPAFRARYPNIDLHFDVGRLTSPDENADLTLLLRPGTGIDGDFVARLLAWSHVVLCATPGYLDRAGRPTHPEDLRKHEMLVPDLPDSRGEAVFHPVGESTSSASSVHLPRPSMRVSSADPPVLTAAARHGLGITAALSLDVADSLRSGELERVLPDWQIATYHVYAAVPTRKHMPARTRVMLDYLVEVFGGMANDPWLAGQAV